mmetsp:Transcript_7863/g.23135  ORF Transcript_7863/g.23135 Transcript_7863/m.23135 type:complete len:297 (+) Transcript_7863:863-1753(+)
MQFLCGRHSVSATIHITVATGGKIPPSLFFWFRYSYQYCISNRFARQDSSRFNGCPVSAGPKRSFPPWCACPVHVPVPVPFPLSCAVDRPPRNGSSSAAPPLVPPPHTPLSLQLSVSLPTGGPPLPSGSSAWRAKSRVSCTGSPSAGSWAFDLPRFFCIPWAAARVGSGNPAASPGAGPAGAQIPAIARGPRAEKWAPRKPTPMLALVRGAETDRPSAAWGFSGQSRRWWFHRTVPRCCNRVPTGDQAAAAAAFVVVGFLLVFVFVVDFVPCASFRATAARGEGLSAGTRVARDFG